MSKSIKKVEDHEQAPSPAMLLQMAVQQNFDIDKLKQLMDLQERWDAKQAKKAFVEALSKFQTKVPILKKTKTARINSQNGASYSYRYSDLGTITSQIKNALNECGLSYRWEFDENGGKMKVTCIITHIEGHEATTTMEAAADASGGKNAIQQKGSTHTYLQRYTLIGALGLSTADDDIDGYAGKQPVDEVDYEETLKQWEQTISQCKTQHEVTRLYLKNKKVVDNDKKIQALLKAKETEIKSQNPNPEKVTLP